MRKIKTVNAFGDVCESSFSSDGRYITEECGKLFKHTFEIVDAVPHGYSICWSIGHPVAGEYIPLYRLSLHQPYPGAKYIDTNALKAIRCQGAQTVMDAIFSYGPETLEQMERYLKNCEQGKSKDPVQTKAIQGIKAALPFLRELKWE